MVRGIGPVLDLLDLRLPPTEQQAHQLGVIDKCQLAWGWLQQFVKEDEEFAGAHVLSMVRMHYPLIDFMCFTKGYPKEVGVQEAGELQGQLSELAATIIGDINLCGTPTPPLQGTPMTSAPGSSSRPPRTAISTNQSQAVQSSSKEQPKPAVTTSQTPAAQARSVEATP
jgi:hypothetical protein